MSKFVEQILRFKGVNVLFNIVMEFLRKFFGLKQFLCQCLLGWEKKSALGLMFNAVVWERIRWLLMSRDVWNRSTNQHTKCPANLSNSQATVHYDSMNTLCFTPFMFNILNNVVSDILIIQVTIIIGADTIYHTMIRSHNDSLNH